MSPAFYTDSIEQRFSTCGLNQWSAWWFASKD